MHRRRTAWFRLGIFVLALVVAGCEQPPPPKPIALTPKDKELASGWKSVWSVDLPSAPPHDCGLALVRYAPRAAQPEALVTDSETERHVFSLDGMPIARSKPGDSEYLFAMRRSGQSDAIAEYGT